MHRIAPGFALLCSLALVSCSPSTSPTDDPSPSRAADPNPTTTEPATKEPDAAQPDTGRSDSVAGYVLAISVDGLNTEALATLGPSGTPHLHRLMDEGMTTLNARTAVEKTITLPNHAGMLTGRRVDAGMDGHGVVINGDSDTTVHELAGHHVDSIFSVVDAAGLDSALFTSKDKFELFDRSWPELDRFTYIEENEPLVDAAVESLADDPHELTFVHISGPDKAGHEHGFMSPEYLDAVRTTDSLVGELLAAVETSATLDDNLAVILTADHGGAAGDESHNSRSALENYRIPFMVWGAGVGTGDLYERNEDFREPDSALVNYLGRQPIRNANLANLSLELLGLGPVPGSQIDRAQELDVD